MGGWEYWWHLVGSGGSGRGFWSFRPYLRYLRNKSERLLNDK